MAGEAALRLLPALQEADPDDRRGPAVGGQVAACGVHQDQQVGKHGDQEDWQPGELAPLVLNGPPSVTGFAGGRPKVEEIVAYWPALIDKSVVTTSVEIV